MHPSQLPLEQLEKECRWSFSRASGPGGQHRNKVETATTIEHLPSGIRATATEKRSQQANREVAMQRLRCALAVELLDSTRRGPVSDPSDRERPSALWQQYCRQGRIRISPTNIDYPAVLAEILLALVALDVDLAKAASHFATSGTQLVKVLADYPPALRWLNDKLVGRGQAPRNP